MRDAPTCFISHKFGDPVLARCLKHRMPGGDKPFVFRAIDETPDIAVTDHLLDNIRRRRSLVYLDTPASLASPWVGFERNYAARLDKPVHAFTRAGLGWGFRRDRRPAVDPLVSVLFNLVVQEDAQTIQRLRQKIWDVHRFEFRGDVWRQMDNDVRQMFDTINGIGVKIARGGVAILFLSNASVSAAAHDYADALTHRVAKRDMETALGHTDARFAALPAGRTIVVWLDKPDEQRLQIELLKLDPAMWSNYLRVVRGALADPAPLVAFQPNGDFNRQALNRMIVRTFWTALQTDADMANEFRASFEARQSRTPPAHPAQPPPAPGLSPRGAPARHVASR